MLVGDAVECCPTALGLGDVEVLRVAAMLPGPGYAGDLAGIPSASLPPRYRAMMDAAQSWCAMWERQRSAHA